MLEGIEGMQHLNKGKHLGHGFVHRSGQINRIPRGSGANIQMHGDLQFPRAFQQTGRYPEIASISQWIWYRGTARGAKVRTEPRGLDERRDTLLARTPAEIFECNNSGGVRSGSTLLAAQRAMALVQLWDGPNDFERNCFTETFAEHDFAFQRARSGNAAACWLQGNVGPQY